MEIGFGVAARERRFSKAMRRVRPRLGSLFDAIESTILSEPHPDTLLLGVTDEKKNDYFEIVPNQDGFFQVLAGLEMVDSEAELVDSVVAILHRAIRECPLSSKDRDRIEKVFDDWHSGP